MYGGIGLGSIIIISCLVCISRKCTFPKSSSKEFKTPEKEIDDEKNPAVNDTTNSKSALMFKQKMTREELLKKE